MMWLHVHLIMLLLKVSAPEKLHECALQFFLTKNLSMMQNLLLP